MGIFSKIGEKVGGVIGANRGERRGNDIGSKEYNELPLHRRIFTDKDRFINEHVDGERTHGKEEGKKIGRSVGRVVDLGVRVGGDFPDLFD